MESQIESSQSNKADKGKKRISADGAAAARKLETLRLAHIHLRQQLRASQHPRHREMLQSALTELEKQLADLGGLDRSAES